MLKPSLRSFLICLTILNLSSCASWSPRNYEFIFKYHPKVGGGVKFGVLDHKFVELSEAEIQEILKTAVIMPAKTWEMISVDLIKACNMLGKKCDKEVTILNGMFNSIYILNNQLEQK